LLRGRFNVNIASLTPLNISQTVRGRGLAVQRTIDRKWSMGNQRATGSMASRDPEKSNTWPEYV